MSGQNGFTLTELTVAGFASTILAGAFFTLFHFTGTQMESSVRRDRLAHRYSVVVENIKRKVRTGDYVTTSVDPDPDAPADTIGPNAWSGLNNVTIRREGGAIVGGFRYQALATPPHYALQERLPNGNWEYFLIGSDTVHGLPHPFSIAPGRRGISFTIHLTNVEDGEATDSLFSATEVARCRNIYHQP
jgi:hypothetical protein